MSASGSIFRLILTHHRTQTPRDFGHDVTSLRATTVPVVELPPKKRRKSGRKFEIFEGESLSMFMREVVELQGAVSRIETAIIRQTTILLQLCNVIEDHGM